LSRTVSSRIPKELHEELRERCNQIGESMNDFIKAAIEFALWESTDFDFGNEEDEPKANSSTKPVAKAELISIDDVPVSELQNVKIVDL